MFRRALPAVLVLAAAACGSVGNGPKDAGGGAGGSSGGTGGAGGAAGAGGAGGVDAAAGGSGGTAGSGSGGSAGADAAVTDAPHDSSSDGPLPPASCQVIKQQNPTAASGVFTIAPLGTPEQVFCEMASDNGGWTAFYIGDNGSAPGGAHFETAADACPDPMNSCLRRLPVTIDETHDFAVKCGAAVVKFKIPPSTTAGTPPPLIDYFKNGLTHTWQTVTNAVTIDVGFVGKANLVGFVWTGDPNSPTNSGWIIAGDDNTTTTTFGNGYTLNTGWNYCNGAPDNTSRVMLFYR